MTATRKPDAADQPDRLFSEFFQGEMPNPWPEFRAPQPVEPSTMATRVLAEPTNEPRHAARLTLGASAAALLAFGLFMTSGPRPANVDRASLKVEPAAGLLNRATADGKKMQPPSVDTAPRK